MIKKRIATIEDVSYIADRMRQEDVEEVWALIRCTGREALLASYHASQECWVGEQDGTVFCIFGCVPSVSGGATLWMLFTSDVRYLPLSFFRQSKVHLETLLASYGRLSNYTDTKNTFILKWLKWLGFTVSKAQPMGIDGKLCRPFWIERSEDSCVCRFSQQ